MRGEGDGERGGGGEYVLEYSERVVHTVVNWLLVSSEFIAADCGGAVRLSGGKLK